MILAKWKQFQTQERDLDFVVVSTDLGDGGSCMATIPFPHRDSVSHISVVKTICRINQLAIEAPGTMQSVREVFTRCCKEEILVGFYFLLIVEFD